MLQINDQIGRSVEIRHKPERIVCLVPSLTELLCDLGLGYKLVGVTKYCVHPEEIRNETAQIGGTKKPEIAHIEQLKPDFILANKEENTREAIHKLEKIAPVYVSDISNFQELEACLLAIGKICGMDSGAAALLGRLKLTYGLLQAEFTALKPVSALYLIWQKPFMAAGTDTYISWMLRSIGISNALEQLGDEGMRYPRLEPEQIATLKPQVIFLSTEPYPFTPEMAKEMEATFSIPCICVDGEAFSWYGTRIFETAPYISQIAQQVRGTYR